MPQVYPVAIAWNWEYDADFVTLLDGACRARGLALLQVTPVTLPSTIAQLNAGEISLHMLLDRAWDVDESFIPIADVCRARKHRILNDRPVALRAWDKATMHLEFIAAGLHTPHAIVLPPFNDRPDVPLPDLSQLGAPFIIKPAMGGGGSGVNHNLTTWMQIQHFRQEFPTDKYLIQAKITPRPTEIGPAWFRVIYVLGEVLPFWWNVHTHEYRTVTSEQERRLGLAPLRDVARTIARVCRLDLFSTEIAQRSEDGAFVSVDYVNDPIDLRLQSTAVDGVPDATVRQIAQRIAQCALTQPDAQPMKIDQDLPAAR